MKQTLLFLCSLIILSCSENVEEKVATDFCANIHRNDSTSLSKELEGVLDMMQTKTGVYVLEEGDNAMITRAWLSEYAEKTIDIQYFIFSTDNVGLIACDYIVRAADRGVKVRILVDDIMVDADIEDILLMNSHKNISIKIYNPGVNLGKNIFQKVKKFTTDFRSANQRMHNKTFIVDNKVVITGGRNIADEYFDYDHQYNFRDRDVLLLGKTVSAVDRSFNEYWRSDLSVNVELLSDIEPDTSVNRFVALHEYACNPENFWPKVRAKIDHLPNDFDFIISQGELTWVEDVYFIADLPGKNDGSQGLSGGGITTSALFELVRNAKDAIVIQTPYLITTESSRQLFKEAVERGVKIKIMTNSLASTDNVEAFSSYQSSRTELLNTGVEIYEFKPDAAIRKTIMSGELHKNAEHLPIFGHHAKSMVIDGETTVIGTFNLDPRSANLNTECITIIKSKGITEKVLAGMEEELKPENSWFITHNFNPDASVSNYKRLKTWTRKIIPKEIL